ncbi:unnamed protein product [Blepharisma stoltei]|uniref:Uncharacterized protein n=1 Tax=Blepharisma stoltei TaxID=1481888 RepID=A0AAU9K978_9CILI|nr:unnamed protein product [Blepharisma stoltei]
MLSEDQFFEAKSFLQVYKDAHRCLEQAARKKAAFDKYNAFYSKVKEGQDERELSFDTQGNLQPAVNFKSGFFLKLGQFVNKNVNSKLESLPNSYEALSSHLTGVIEDLKKEILTAKTKA